MKRKSVLLMAMITIVIVTLMGCTSNSNEPEKLEEAYNEEWVFSLDNKDIRLACDFQIGNENDIESDDYQESLDTVGKFETKFEIAEQQIFEETKNSLIAFTKEYFGVDVSDKMSELETYVYSKMYDENSTKERGYYTPGTKKIKINRAILENWEEDDIRLIWAHEVFHYLGLVHQDSRSWILYESMTAAVTDLFAEWAGYTITQFDDYQVVKKLSLQMIKANPSLISDILIDPNKKIEDNINVVLKTANYPYYPLNGMKIAELFSGMMELMITFPDVMNYCTSQEIALAYCRTFELNQEKKEYIKKQFVIQDFEKGFVEINSYTGYYEWYCR